MKYSAKFSLEIKMKEFYKYAIPLVTKNVLHKAIKNELYQSWHGIVNGDWGGTSRNWEEIFYYNLYKDDYIKQTKESVDRFGEFKKNK